MAKKPTFPKRVFRHDLPKSFGGESYQIGDGGKHFQLTPEKLKEAVNDQAQWAEGAQSPFVNVSPQMAMVYRARRELKDWHEALQQVEIALAMAKRGQKKELLVRRAHFQSLLAECFGILGMYSEAIAVSPKGDKLKKKEWRVLQKAMATTDGCKCSIEGHPFLVSKDRVHAQIYNPKTGKIVPVIACNVCNKLSVKSMSPELMSQRDARTKAQELSQGKTRAAAHRELREHKLTSEHVFNLRQ